jgi:hypothetical protein
MAVTASHEYPGPTLSVQGDIFAFGSVLYEIITGNAPYADSAEDERNLIGQIFSHRSPKSGDEANATCTPASSTAVGCSNPRSSSDLHTLPYASHSAPLMQSSSKVPLVAKSLHCQQHTPSSSLGSQGATSPNKQAVRSCTTNSTKRNPSSRHTSVPVPTALRSAQALKDTSGSKTLLASQCQACQSCGQSTPQCNNAEISEKPASLEIVIENRDQDQLLAYIHIKSQHNPSSTTNGKTVLLNLLPRTAPLKEKVEVSVGLKLDSQTGREVPTVDLC